MGKENIAIVGRGRIDGAGWNWWRDDRSAEARAGIEAWHALQARIEAGEKPGPGEFARAAQHLRPSLVQFNGCRNVLVEGVTLAESPMWLFHPIYCENVAARGVSFLSTGPNGDGIAVDSCRDVRVSDCFFNTGDDCIALKSGRDADGRRAARPTENVTITNCVMHGGHAAIAIGSETAGGIRDVIASNIVVRGTERGIRLKSSRGRGGVVENLRFENLVIEDTLEHAVEITAHYGKLPPEPFSERTPVFRNIAFSHLTIANARRIAAIAGLEEQAVEQVRFTDVTAAGQGGISCDCACDVQFNGVSVNAAAGEPFAFSRARGLKIDGAPAGADQG
jgi:polygalacturonase